MYFSLEMGYKLANVCMKRRAVCAVYIGLAGAYNPLEREECVTLGCHLVTLYRLLVICHRLSIIHLRPDAPSSAISAKDLLERNYVPVSLGSTTG
jgi:hypothetical protein